MHELEQASKSQAGPLRVQILSFFFRHMEELLGKALARQVRGNEVYWGQESDKPPHLMVRASWWQGLRFIMECTMHWRLGFIHRAVMEGRASQTQEPPEESGVAALLRQLLPHASARFLRRLDISLSHVDEAGYVSAIEALAETGCPQTLETLSLYAGDIPLTRHLRDAGAGSLEPLYSRLPRLHKLVLQGSRLELGALRLPELRELTLSPEGHRGMLRPAVARSIASAELPRLESLSFSMGWDYETPESGLPELLPLLDGVGMPNLRKLTLQDLGFSDALCKQLPGSALLSRLRELDLSNGTMTDEGAKALLANARAFRHLERLRLGHQLQDETLRERLWALCANVEFGD
ncbi:hypothetical protein [Pyxidicoccus parkwayensis]|nr:hypothetical protein [Pyxidicoccus parkwaysis]